MDVGTPMTADTGGNRWLYDVIDCQLPKNLPTFSYIFGKAQATLPTFLKIEVLLSSNRITLIMADDGSVSSFESVNTGSGTDSQGDLSSKKTTQSQTDATQRSKEEEEELAAKETRNVFRLRVLVILVLLLAGCAVAVVVFIVASKGETEQSNSHYEGSAQKIISSFEQVVSQKVAAITSLAVTLTAYARSQNDTWPFVTMNDFQQRSAMVRSLSDCLFLELLPIVTDENRAAYEAYALKNKGWLDDGRAWQDQLHLGFSTSRRELEATENVPRKMQDGGVFGSATSGGVTGNQVLNFTNGKQGASTIANQIFTLDSNWKPVVDPGPGPYTPIWESSPILPSPRDLVNYNLRHYPWYGPFINQTLRTGQIALGGIVMSAPGDIAALDLSTSFFAFIISFAAGKSVNYTGDPMSSIYIPVFDDFTADRKTVGIIVAVINWATYFTNVLPENSEPVCVILENACDGPFTYEVSGQSVTFIGQGDLHDSKFDSQIMTGDFRSLLESSDTQELGYSLNQGECIYSLKVYPTQQLESAYHTMRPTIITFVVAVVFCFAVIMFLIYDRLVERRQKIVMMTAARTTAIVQSLFPQVCCQARPSLARMFCSSSRTNTLLNYCLANSRAVVCRCSGATASLGARQHEQESENLPHFK